MHSFLKSFFKSDPFKHAHLGFYLGDARSGDEIATYNGDLFFIPASLQKVVTAAAALFHLGENFTFKTTLEFDGLVDEPGILQGNLYLVGGGDPSLPLEILDTWEKAIKDAGIVHINGKIISDSSYFEEAAVSPHWCIEDTGNYFGAGSFGLSIHENAYTVSFKPGNEEGELAQVVSIVPEIPGFSFKNRVVTGPAKSGDQVCIYGSPYVSSHFFRGSVPQDEPFFSVHGALYDPPSFMADQLAKRLSPKLGTQTIRQKGELGIKKTLLHEQHSLPLKELIHPMLTYSINLYAENLLKTMGGGFASKGLLLIEKYLKTRGVVCQAKDGSGLARVNLITPIGYSKLLCHLYQDPLYSCLLESLPEAGKEGTLESFPSLKNGVFKAKTGTISGVYNLGGYFYHKNGKVYALCLFCNNYLGDKSLIKEACAHLLNSL